MDDPDQQRSDLQRRGQRHLMAKREITIGQTTFYLSTFPPLEQLRIFGDLQRDLLPAAGDLLAAGGGNGADVALAMQRLSGSMDGAKLVAWVNRLLTPATVSFERDGRGAKRLEPGLFEQAFDDFSEALELTWRVIELNFAGPLGRWLGHFGPGLTLIPGQASDDSATN